MNTEATNLVRAARAAGFDRVRVDANLLVDADEFSFAPSEDGSSWQVIAWSGSYPFAEDTVVGDIVGPFSHALRFARWIEKREALYFDKVYREQEENEPPF